MPIANQRQLIRAAIAELGLEAFCEVAGEVCAEYGAQCVSSDAEMKRAFQRHWEAIGEELRRTAGSARRRFIGTPFLMDQPHARNSADRDLRFRPAFRDPSVVAAKCKACRGRGFRIGTLPGLFMAVERCFACNAIQTNASVARIAHRDYGIETAPPNGFGSAQLIIGNDLTFILHNSGKQPGGNKVCPHHRNAALFVTDTTGLLDECEVCGEEWA